MIAPVAAALLVTLQPTLASPQSTLLNTGFAVVELFTSEGCSSCPPADRLLHQIVKDTQARGLPVYVLGYHVDYWDDARWQDRFASRYHTARQRVYAANLSKGKVFTPYMVVNGRTAFVGSDAKQAARVVGQALTGNASREIILTGVQVTPIGTKHQITIAYRLPMPLTRGFVTLAAVEADVESKIRGGENKGEHLIHANVVRALGVDELTGQGMGQMRLEIPADVNLDRVSLIAMLQGVDSQTILGATSRPLTPGRIERGPASEPF